MATSSPAVPVAAHGDRSVDVTWVAPSSEDPITDPRIGWSTGGGTTRSKPMDVGFSRPLSHTVTSVANGTTCKVPGRRPDRSRRDVDGRGAVAQFHGGHARRAITRCETDAHRPTGAPQRWRSPKGSRRLTIRSPPSPPSPPSPRSSGRGGTGGPDRSTDGVAWAPAAARGCRAGGAARGQSQAASSVASSSSKNSSPTPGGRASRSHAATGGSSTTRCHEPRGRCVEEG